MDDLSTQLAVNAITELLKETLKSVRDLANFFTNKVKNEDVFSFIARNYVHSISQRYSMIKIFGMEKPIRLEKIYTRLSVLEKIPSRHYQSYEELIEFFEKNQRRFGNRIATRPAIDIVNELEKIVLLGKPGSGKTTFLRHLVLKSISGGLNRKVIPIYVSLNDFSSTEFTLMDYMQREFNLSINSSPNNIIKTLLKKNKCLILFDGLDEVLEGKRDFIIKEIIAFSDKYTNNKIIISCRTAAYSYWFENFTDVEIADFSKEEVFSFANSWFGDEKKALNRISHLINTNNNILEIATTPLLLAMMCIAFESTMTISENRAELYKDAIDVLLKKWDSSRRVVRDLIYKEFTIKRKEDLISFLAATTFEKKQYFFPKRKIASLIRNFIINLPSTIESDAEKDSGSILDSIEAQHGILVQRAKGIYSFSHLTFQEYFTANYVVKAGEKSQIALVQYHLQDVRWREVIILVACLLPEADTFLLKILEMMANIGFPASHFNSLKKQLSKIKQKLGSEGSLSDTFSSLSYDNVSTATQSIKNSYINPDNIRHLRLITSSGKRYDPKIAMTLLKSKRPDLSPKMDKDFINFLDSLLGNFRNDGTSFFRFIENNYTKLYFVLKRNYIDEIFKVRDEINEVILKYYYKHKLGIKHIKTHKDINDQVLKGLLSEISGYIEESHSQFILRAQSSKLFVVAETLAEILVCPIYIRRETREIAIKTISDIVEYFPDPPDGPIGEIDHIKIKKKR